MSTHIALNAHVIVLIVAMALVGLAALKVSEPAHFSWWYGGVWFVLLAVFFV